MSGYPGNYRPPAQQGGYAPYPGQQTGQYPPAGAPQGGYGQYPPAQGGYAPAGSQYQGAPGYPPQQQGQYAPPPQQQGYAGSQYPPQNQSAYPPYGAQATAPGSVYPPGAVRPPVPAGQMPPGADPTLWNYFVAVDADKSGQIDVHELSQALRNGDFQPYGLDTLSILMNMFDVDRSGTINFNEFAALWKYLNEWQRCFQQFDTDRTGAINATELKNALRNFGYTITDRVAHAVIRKFSKPGLAEISFDKFIRICVTVRVLTEEFMKLDNDRDGVIHINHDEFLHLVITRSP